MSHQSSAETPAPNSGRLPLPELLLPDEPASSTAAQTEAQQPSIGTLNEPYEMVLPGSTHPEAPGAGQEASDTMHVSTATTLGRPSHSQASRSQITLLTHHQAMELSPINAAAAHQDSGLAVRRAQNQLRSRNQGGRQEINNYQFRPSQQQRGLNLFHMEPRSALDQARALAEGLAATVPKTDPPRPGMKEMELTLVQRVNEAASNSQD